MIRHYLTEAIEKVVKASEKRRVVTAEDVAQMVTFAEDVLISWMGRDGDEAFLDFYCLANAALPPMNLIVAGRFGGRGGRVDYLESRRISLMGIASTKALSIYNTTRRGPGPAIKSLDQLSENQRDYLLHRAYDHMTHEAQRRMLVEQYTAVLPLRDPSALFVMVPSLDYRTDLMGELARPWQVLPPPYGPYQPRRRP